MMEGTTFYFEFEPALMEWLQRGMGPAMTVIMSVVTMLGEEALVVAILGFLYWVWDKEAGIRIGTNVLAGSVWNPLLKNIALRRRPYFDHAEIQCLKPVHAGDIYDIALQGYSFPSGHSTTAVTMYASCAMLFKKRVLTVLAVLLPLIVGISRVALGVHYPTDVLTGWLLGLLVICITAYLQRIIHVRWKLHLVLLIISLPGLLYCRTNDYYTCLGIMAGMFLADWYDTNYVRFSSTRHAGCAVLRLVCGFLLYFGLNTLFKLPFSDEFLSSATTGQFMLRMLRYFLVSFLMLGVYPMLFAPVEGRLFNQSSVSP